MSGAERTAFATTKLIVHELEKSAEFYCEAYGFVQAGRLQAAIAGEPIDEIFLGREGATPGAPGGLILMRYIERPAPANGEVILVFTTDDLDALCDRVRAAGGTVPVEPYQSEATPYRAAFTTDPEGHWIENVELVPADA